MKSSQANQLLSKESEGTFLLRETEGNLRFSLVSNQDLSTRISTPNIAHIPITQADDGNGWFIRQIHYSSILEIVEAYKMQTGGKFEFKHEYKRN